MAKNDTFWKFAKKCTDKIHGWLSDKENRSLYDAAKNCVGKGVIIEIGSWKGRSTICLALGSKSGLGTKVYAIDPHTGSPDLQREGEIIWTYDEFLQNIKRARVENIVMPVVDTAENAVVGWKLPIELIFIDANYHSYELTKKNVLEWSEYLVDGGVLALNNVAPSFSAILQNKPLHGLPAPRKVASQFIFRSGNFKNFRLAGCVAYAEKCHQNTFLDKLNGELMEQKVNLLFMAHGIYLQLTRLPQPIKSFFKKILFFR